MLRLGLQEGRDYKLVGEAAWRALQKMHGGGPAIARPVIRSCVCSFWLGEQQFPVYIGGGFDQSPFGQKVSCKLLAQEMPTLMSVAWAYTRSHSSPRLSGLQSRFPHRLP